MCNCEATQQTISVMPPSDFPSFEWRKTADILPVKPLHSLSFLCLVFSI